MPVNVIHSMKAAQMANPLGATTRGRRTSDATMNSAAIGHTNPPSPMSHHTGNPRNSSDSCHPGLSQRGPVRSRTAVACIRCLVPFGGPTASGYRRKRSVC